MNRLIHRSWGEDFVKIILDLSKYIYHFRHNLILDHFGDQDVPITPLDGLRFHL